MFNLGYISADFVQPVGMPFRLSQSCGYLRCELPREQLNKHGWSTVHNDRMYAQKDGTLAIAGPDGELRTDLDIISMQRCTDPHAVELIKRAQAMGQKIITDIDDWFWGMDTQNDAWAKMQKSHDSNSNLETYRAVVAACDAVTVSTPFLKSKFERMDKPIYIVRNAINFRHWKPQQVRDQQIHVGWHGTTIKRPTDLKQLSGIIGPYLEKIDGRFIHVGFDHTHPVSWDLMKIDVERMILRPVSAIQALPSMLGGIDIGVVPLRDFGFNHAKSNLKGLEYAAAGIPFIASYSPEYEYFDKDSVAYRAKDWIKKLNKLRDPDERLILRARQMERAKDFDIEQRWVDWDKTFKEILSL